MLNASGISPLAAHLLAPQQEEETERLPAAAEEEAAAAAASEVRLLRSIAADCLMVIRPPKSGRVR